MDVELKAFLQRAESVLARVEPLLPSQPPVINWDRTFAARWQRDARSGFLAPLEVSLDLSLADLIGIDRQRDLLSANTRQFVDGLPANHVLLWGARGTGKSSLIRALLAEYAADGLRLIEIERDHLADLPRVVEQLAGLQHTFVLFCDDLSFEAGEGDYRVLKSVLDGSLERAPENVLLYATSNRRHLVPERQSDKRTGRWSTANCTRTKRWKTRSRCPTASVCGCRSTPLPSSTTSVWYTTGSIRWRGGPASIGRGAKPWRRMRFVGQPGAATATVAAPTSTLGSGWVSVCSKREAERIC